MSAGIVMWTRSIRQRLNARHVMVGYNDGKDMRLDCAWVLRIIDSRITTEIVADSLDDLMNKGNSHVEAKTR